MRKIIPCMVLIAACSSSNEPTAEETCNRSGGSYTLVASRVSDADDTGTCYDGMAALQLDLVLAREAADTWTATWGGDPCEVLVSPACRVVMACEGASFGFDLGEDGVQNGRATLTSTDTGGACRATFTF